MGILYVVLADNQSPTRLLMLATLLTEDGWLPGGMKETYTPNAQAVIGSMRAT